ncbi:MAG: hypothetical protein NVS4B3_15530 [Gemmatimonadaceae bacterium]
MSTSFSRKAVVFGLVLLPLATGGFVLQSRSTHDSARLFDQVLSLVSDRFVDTLATGSLYERAAKGLVHELNDPYTELMAPKQYQRFSTSTNGRYGGIGMQIEDQQGNITVARVFPNTPAEQAGVREGDRIVTIDTVSTRGWKLSQVSETLLGEPGSKVNVRFGRPGVADPIQVRFTRAVIRIPAVPYSLMLDARVGYIPVHQFNETASSEVEAAVRHLVSEGARGIVLDMRENPGGILEQSLAMSSLFLPSGVEIAAVRGRTDPQTYTARGRPVAPSIPLVVLINGYTASAAEIVAGALQDHDRALIVGTTSWGKGLVQTLFPLDGGYALKITTAKWFTPSGRSIQKERKVVDGKFVEESDTRVGQKSYESASRDSLETEAVKKTRPAYKSDAGRIVYGGGAITPDVIVPEDTLSAAEQKLAKAIAPKSPQVYSVVYDYAFELKSKVSPTFRPDPVWRTDLYTRLQKAGVVVDRPTYDAGALYLERELTKKVTRFAFGDSAAKRREIKDDVQLRRALALLEKGQTQRDLFTIAKSPVGVSPSR